jgi:hypothetical protein
MGRINRRLWTNEQIGYKYKGGLADLLDNAIKSAFRINDEEYNLLCEKATEKELNTIILDEKEFTFKRGREAIQILNKYINYG